MTRTACYVQLEAKPGKEAQVANFLKNALPLVENEPNTTAWFAMKMGPTTFGIFDAFPNESAREAHMKGQLADALMKQAPDLFTNKPEIHKLDIIADKLPH